MAPVLRSAQPVESGPYVVSQYGWGPRTLTFVTDSREDTSYADWIRTGFVLENHVQLLLGLLEQGASCVDVGANVGAFAVPLAASGKNVLAVEALPNNHVMLTLASALAGHRRLQPIHAALADQVGIATMAGEGPWGHMREGGQLQVPMLTLDVLLSVTRFPLPDVVKIDVEGAERAVLAGAQQVFARRLPILIVESNTWTCRESGYTYHELLADMERLGYHLYLVANNVLAPRTSVDIQERCVADYVAFPSALTTAPAGFRVRPLTPDERMALLESDIDVAMPHRWHVATMLREYAAMLAGDERAAALHSRLEQYEENIVHEALRGEPGP